MRTSFLAVCVCLMAVGTLASSEAALRGAKASGKGTLSVESTSACSALSSDSAKFLCGMANAAWEGLFPNSDLLQCVEEGAIGIDDFYHAGTSMISAYKQYESDNHSGAESDLDAGLHSLKSGLGEFEQMLGNCKELAGLAERVGGIVADLDNVIGETIKLVEILTKAENIYDDAENMVDNWGNWVQCGVDAANIICDASQIWGYGC